MCKPVFGEIRKRSKRNFVPNEGSRFPQTTKQYLPPTTNNIKESVSIDIMTSLGNEQSCESDNPSLLDEHSQKSYSCAVWLFFICWIVTWKGYSIQFLLIFRKGKNLEAKTNAICSMVSNKTPSAFQQDFVTAFTFVTCSRCMLLCEDWICVAYNLFLLVYSESLLKNRVGSIGDPPSLLFKPPPLIIA